MGKCFHENVWLCFKFRLNSDMRWINILLSFALMQLASAAVNKPMKFFMYELGGWTNISEFTLTPRQPSDKRSFGMYCA